MYGYYGTYLLEMKNRDNFIKIKYYYMNCINLIYKSKKKKITLYISKYLLFNTRYKYNIPLIFDKSIYTQACINNNQMFKIKKSMN